MKSDIVVIPIVVKVCSLSWVPSGFCDGGEWFQCSQWLGG